MWSETIIIFAGVAAILLGIFGRRFGGRPGKSGTVPIWQGRAWFIFVGCFLIFAGVARYLPGKSATFISGVFERFDIGFELLFGTIFAVLGIVFLLGAIKNRADAVTKLIGGMSAFFGIALIADVIWRFKRL